MGELRRNDIVRGIQTRETRIRGSTYNTLRVTIGTAGFARRTSGKTLRAAGNIAMNRVKAALLGGNRNEILKYMTPEEVRRWDSLSTFQKRKIIQQAEKNADAVIERDTKETERTKILARKMNRLAREKLPFRYEVETIAGSTASEMRRSQKIYKRQMKNAADAGLKTGPGLHQENILTNVRVVDAGKTVHDKDYKMPGMADAIQGQTGGSIPGESLKHNTGTHRSIPFEGNMEKASREFLQSTVFYAENERIGERKAAKVQRKFRKAVVRENREKVATFLGDILYSVNKNVEKSRRVKEQYRNRQITIDRYAEEVRSNSLSAVFMPVRAAGRTMLRKAGKKIGEILLNLIPPFLKHLFAWFLGGAALLLIFFMLLSILMAGGSQERQADLGLWRLTAYCNCSVCCGRWAGGPTASGVMPTAGRTVAIHSTTMEAFGLRFGDRLMIRDHIYVLEDHGGSEMGGSNGGKCVDIYVDSHSECYNDAFNGYANVYLVSEDGSLSLIGGGSGDSIVAFADQFLGCPYVWGGESLTDGCDCSHFVWLVLMHCGVYSGEYLVSNEWAYAGTPVGSLAEARAGDVVVYDGHVAIYDGAGMIIEAKGSAWGITHDRNVTCKPIAAIRRFT